MWPIWSRGIKSKPSSITEFHKLHKSVWPRPHDYTTHKIPDIVFLKMTSSSELALCLIEKNTSARDTPTNGFLVDGMIA
jgi:hypothetical protein